MGTERLQEQGGPVESLRHPYGPSLSLQALPFTLHPELRLGLYPSNDTGG